MTAVTQSPHRGHEVAELLHRRALYCVYAELRVLLTDLGGLLKRWGIECCLRLLKVLKSEQDYALGWLAFDRGGPTATREIFRTIVQKCFRTRRKVFLHVAVLVSYFDFRNCISRWICLGVEALNGCRAKSNTGEQRRSYRAFST